MKLIKNKKFLVIFSSIIIAIISTIVTISLFVVKDKEIVNSVEGAYYFMDGVPTFDDYNNYTEFIIYDFDDLKNFATSVGNGYTYEGKLVRLIDDIYGGNEEMYPIGWSNRNYNDGYTFFGGTFDGCGHYIGGIKIVTPPNPRPRKTYYYAYGLFSFLGSATIKNLEFCNSTINIDVLTYGNYNLYVGCIAGSIASGVSSSDPTYTVNILNCNVYEIDIKGYNKNGYGVTSGYGTYPTKYMAGIIGSAFGNTTIKYCFVEYIYSKYYDSCNLPGATASYNAGIANVSAGHKIIVSDNIVNWDTCSFYYRWWVGESFDGANSFDEDWRYVTWNYGEYRMTDVDNAITDKGTDNNNVFVANNYSENTGDGFKNLDDGFSDGKTNNLARGGGSTGWYYVSEKMEWPKQRCYITWKTISFKCDISSIEILPTSVEIPSYFDSQIDENKLSKDSLNFYSQRISMQPSLCHKFSHWEYQGSNTNLYKLIVENRTVPIKFLNITNVTGYEGLSITTKNVDLGESYNINCGEEIIIRYEKNIKEGFNTIEIIFTDSDEIKRSVTYTARPGYYITKSSLMEPVSINTADVYEVHSHSVPPSTLSIKVDKPILKQYNITFQ